MACWFCGEEILDTYGDDVRFSREFDCYFHLSCLQKRCDDVKELMIFISEFSDELN